MSEVAVRFYQLASRPAEAVLPSLVERALAAGHRLLVRAAAERLPALDRALWVQPADSFVPHGIDSDLGPARAATQPVLLSAADLPAANGADCLFQVGGDLPERLDGCARVMFLFDADDVEIARAAWRRVKGMPGAAPQYWREGEGGRFE